MHENAGKYYHSFTFRDAKESRAILSQIRLIDARRMSYSLGTISIEDFEVIKIKIKELLP